MLVYVDSAGGRRLTLPTGERITEREVGVRLSSFVTPTFVFLEPYGYEILKVAGVQTAEDLLLSHRYVSGGLYKTVEFSEFLSREH